MWIIATQHVYTATYYSSFILAKLMWLYVITYFVSYTSVYEMDNEKSTNKDISSTGTKQIYS